MYGTGTQEELDYLMIDDLMFDMIWGYGAQEELVKNYSGLTCRAFARVGSTADSHDRAHTLGIRTNGLGPIVRGTNSPNTLSNISWALVLVGSSRLGPCTIGPGRLGPASQSIGPGQLVGRAHTRTIGPTSMESYKLSQGCRPTYRKTPRQYVYIGPRPISSTLY